MEANQALSPKENIIWLVKKIINEVFSLSLLLYLALFVIEEFKSGAVKNFLSLDYFLILVIVSGSLTIVTRSSNFLDTKDEVPRKSLDRLSYLIALVLGVVCGVFMYLKLEEISTWLAATISVLGGILTFLIAILFLNKNSRAK